MKTFCKSEFDFFPAQGIRTHNIEGTRILQIPAQVLQRTAELSFARLSFCFSKKHVENLIAACLAPDSSANDRYVCASMLKNAAESAKGVLPLCQDTGIASIFGFRDNGVVVSGGSEAEALAEGARKVYAGRNLRMSTVLPKDFFDEFDPKDNMPPQILVQSAENELGFPAYRLLFCAKGGGSSNKTAFLQKTKAVLNEKSFRALLEEQIPLLGASACPPYTICVVAGGLSPEQNLLALKLATCGELAAPSDEFWEGQVMRIAEGTGLGAQFGGRRMCLEARVLRLPRHGASCPVSIGVSCSAHRNLNALVTEEGIFIEKAAENPAEIEGFAEAARFAEENPAESDSELRISSEGGIDPIRKILSGKRPGTRVFLSGRILVARDAAHARWKQLLDSGGTLPEYCAKYPICYAGPAQTPVGMTIGSFGPTTAGRMDSYAEMLMSRGTALVTLAKGNRSRAWTDSCKKYGAFYLGTPGGIAALIASRYIRSVQVIDYPELGMEAVRLVEVEGLPCFIITNDNGEDFYDRDQHD